MDRCPRYSSVAVLQHKMAVVLFNRHRLGQFHFTSEKRSATQIPGGNYHYVQLCSCFINHYLIHLCSFVLPESKRTCVLMQYNIYLYILADMDE